jgi:hypothetical protein
MRCPELLPLSPERMFNLGDRNGADDDFEWPPTDRSPGEITDVRRPSPSQALVSPEVARSLLEAPDGGTGPDRSSRFVARRN